MTDPRSDKPLQTPPVLPPTYRKPNKFTLILPWILLLLVLLAGLWMMTKPQLPWQKNQAMVASQPSWQPPKSEPVDTKKLGDNPNAAVASYHNAVAAAAQSVVNIYTTQKIEEHPYMNDPMMRRYFEYHGIPNGESDNTNLGSGVIISQDGYIVTNSHVISKADNIIVMLNDGRKARAKVIGNDVESDVAVIKVDLTGLKPLGFREQSTQVGDVVLAIGNPFGVGQTVTQGIISATGRTGLGINTVEDFIQTDAAINPGNSGGALVDAYGQLVGINTAIFSRSGGSMGIGFAIPTEIVKLVMNGIIKDGKVRRGWLGIELQSSMKDPTKLSDDTQGVEVMNVIPGGPAAKAGLQRGDIITAMDNKPVNDANTLIQMVARKAPNSVVNLQVMRNKAQSSVNVTLGERQPQEALTELPMSQNFDQNNDSANQNGASNEDDIPAELMELLRKQH
ncbi:S1C family serine protease [Moraxella osloensis]|uniref:Serine endoprotease DegS n=1 Tax=Faucicola osloensis TaxID=34062 RepID=A0A378Q908_FAUOS|nr:trypsin-like peptidase domain-containing protein [Moraxella osloensis]QPT41579.1 trypsin-like peptidase domain-containing protein [Moraxella osloensis]STY97135.1 Serine endoprotease DegS precursor [Moraxella osloensis]